MIRGCSSDWTAIAVDEVLPIFFAKSSRAAQLLENAQCSINSMLPGFAAPFGQMLLGQGSASGAHPGAQGIWLNLPREYRHEKRDQSPVCFRKQLFGFQAQRIRSVRFANARLHACLRHESVALEAGKVRSDRVISQAQLFREFVHRPFLCPQEVEDFSSRAFEQPLPPAYMFHLLKHHEDPE